CAPLVAAASQANAAIAATLRPCILIAFGHRSRDGTVACHCRADEYPRHSLAVRLASRAARETGEAAVAERRCVDVAPFDVRSPSGSERFQYGFFRRKRRGILSIAVPRGGGGARLLFARGQDAANVLTMRADQARDARNRRHIDSGARD